MFFSIFLAALFLIIILVSTIGYGRFLHSLIFNKSDISNYGEYGLLGLVFVSFVSTFLHFFLKINYYVNLFIYFFGLVLATYFYSEIKIFYKKNKNFLILIFFISLLMLAYHKPNEDFGYYHLPYLINFISEKVIFGLSTIQPNQGWNSMWLNLTATYNLPIIEMRGFHLTNLVFFVFLSFALLDPILNFRKNAQSSFFINNLLNIFGVLFFLYFLIKFSRLNTYGFDVPSNFISIYCFYLFLYYFSLNNDLFDKKKYIFQKITIFSSFAVLIKLSNLLILLLPVFIFLKKEKKILSKSFIFSSCFLIIWSAQQFIYTGCLIFPLILSCFEVAWFNADAALALLEHTKGINKSFAQYKGSLSELEYSQNFNWVTTWFKRTKIEILEHMATFIIILVLIFLCFISKTKKDTLYNKSKIDNIYYIALFIIFFQIFFWFNTSPLVRFGMHYVLLFLFFILILFLNRLLLRTFNHKLIIILIYFGLAINIGKNSFRIFYDIKNNYSFFYSYPEVYYANKYILEKKININYLTKEKSIYCWNAPSLCLAGDQDILINRLNGYLFVSVK
jgi:hypothetical protein